MRKHTISKSNLPGRPHTPPPMTPQIHREPADQYRHCAVAATRHQKQRTILHHVPFRVGNIQQDAVAGHGDEHGDQRECETMA